MVLEFLDKDGNLNKVGVDIQYEFQDGHPRDTHVHLYNVDTDAVVATGTAWLHENDNFSRAMGRKIAFGRAVDVFTGKRVDGWGNVISKGDLVARTELWKQFTEKVRLPRPL